MSTTTDGHVRYTDALTWSMEADPLLRSTIVAVALLGDAPDLDRLRSRIERATCLVPTLRDRLESSPLGLAPPRWVPDPDFDLDWHVRHVALPAPGTLADLLTFARNEGMGAFDPARPLWEAIVVDGVQGGRTALVLKVHHSLTDGIGGIQLAEHVVDLERDAPDPEPVTPPSVPPSREDGLLGRVAEAIAWDVAHLGRAALEEVARVPSIIGAALRDPVGAATGVGRTASSVVRFVRPVTSTRSTLMAERRLQWHYDVLAVPTEGLKEAAHDVSGTLNDAFLAGVAGGMRLYHERKGEPVEALRLTMPISVRRPDDPAGGNRITLVRFDVPVGLDDPIGRMVAIGRACAAQRGEEAIAYSNLIAAVLNLLPAGVVGGMLKHVDLVASNVPGLEIPVWVAGAPVEGFYAFGPTIGAAANLTLMSYAGTCCIGVTTDAAAVSDPDALLDCLADGFAEVLDVAGPGRWSVGLPSRG